MILIIELYNKLKRVSIDLARQNMNIYLILLGLYMLSGIFMFEWAWKEMKVFREVVEERDSRYPAYRRLDVKNWRRWKFYPGAALVLPLRLLLAFLSLMIVYLFIKYYFVAYISTYF